jgi:hypothetical protein
MISLRSCESAFVMEKSNEYRLTLLFDRSPVVATGVLRRSDGIYIITHDDVLPVYAFKMEKELMRLLKDNMEVWYE